MQRDQVSIKNSELSLENDRLQLMKDVINQISDIESARARMEINAQTEEIAEKSYEITLERYDIGEIDSESLFIENQRLKNTRLRVLQSKIDYLLAVARLNLSTYWDFINNRPLTETVQSYITR